MARRRRPPRRRQGSRPRQAPNQVTAFLTMFAVIGVVVVGCEALGRAADSNPPAAPAYSTDLPVVPSEDFTDPDRVGVAPDDGSDGDGSVNLPGDGYVSGPGINCGLSGCHGHILPNFGFHF